MDTADASANTIRYYGTLLRTLSQGDEYETNSETAEAVIRSLLRHQYTPEQITVEPGDFLGDYVLIVMVPSHAPMRGMCFSDDEYELEFEQL